MMNIYKSLLIDYFNAALPNNRCKVFLGSLSSITTKSVIQIFAVFLLAATPQVFAQSYCAPSPTYADGDGIVNVTIGTINNATYLEENNYGDFTDQTVSIGQGVTQAISIGLNTYSAYNVKIWVDWNNNFTFDTNEEVYDINSPGTPRATVTGFFTVPLTATQGNHRLRIGAVATYNGPAVPCYTESNAAYEDYTVNVTAAPSCFSPTALTYVNTGAGIANLSWTAPTAGGLPASYQYAVDLSSTPPTGGNIATSTLINAATVPLNMPAFFHVRTNCGGGDFSAWTTIPFYNGVCVPRPDFTDSDGITNFTLGTINNTTNDEAGHYGDYTNLSADAGQGVTKQFTIGFNTFSDHHVMIWIDWNNDQDFDDEGESVYSGNSEGGEFTNLAGTFLVPANAILGNHRLRIGIDPYYADPPTPCFEAAGSGSFEDYTINVTSPPSCFTPLNITGVNVSAGVANISWTAPVPGAAPTGYQYVVSTSATPPATGTAVTATSVSNVSVTANALNYIHVRTNCGGGDFSEWFTGTLYNGYCIPMPSYVDGEGITNVTIGSVNNTTPVDEENPYYTDYSSVVATIGQGVTQQFKVSLFTYGSYNVKVWIDLNNDLDFDDEGEELYTGNSDPATRSTLLGYFTIPLNAQIGNHRIRIGAIPAYVEEPSQPCYVEYYGDYQDYTVNVTGPPSCYAPTGFGAASSTAGIANLSWTAPIYGDTPTAYQYAVTATDAPPTATDITNVTTTTATNVPVTANVVVYLHVRTNCGGGDFSEWVTIPYYNGVCIPQSQYVDGQGITNVTIGSINNTTQREDTYYGNYSAMIANIGQTVIQPFKISLNVYSPYNVKIWVNFNDDLDFDDAGEELYSGLSADALSTILRGTITIPANAPLGNHRLRIAISPPYSPQPTPCSVEFAGTYEDYTINVTGPPTCYIPVDPTAIATASGRANLSWTAPAQGNTPVAYEYVVDTDNITMPTSGTTVTGTTVTGYTGIIDNVYYYLHVRTKCGPGEFSEWVTSDAFRYLQGDTCESAIDLSGLISPYTSSTEDADDNYNPYCSHNAAPDLFYSITVPNGYTFTASVSDTDYAAISTLFYGSCNARTLIICSEDASEGLSWENVTGSTKTLYWVQDGDFGSFGNFTLDWTLIPPPTCDKPRQLVANVTSPTSVTISWNVPNTGTPVGYEYAVTQSETAPENGQYTTATSVTGIAVTPNVDSYLHVRTICSTADGNSRWVTLPFFSGYCVPKNTDNPTYYITGLTTNGGETNFTSSNTAFSAYTNYTATHSVSTYPGGSFTIRATTPNTTDTFIFSVWIDWNNDFDFDDAGERMVSSGTITTPANIGSISIPTTAALGTYRMRVRNTHIGSPVPACGEAAGEAEDYTFIVTAVPPCLPPFNLTITPEGSGFATLRWSPAILGDPAASYEYVFSSSPNAPAGSGILSSSFFIEGAEYDPSQSVYLFVRSNCGNGNVSSWTTPASILGTDNPELQHNNVIVYKEGAVINITSGSTLIKGVTIYDTRGRKLYSQADINTTEVALTGLQIQQQVVIVEVTTIKGKVSKRIVF